MYKRGYLMVELVILVCLTILLFTIFLSNQAKLRQEELLVNNQMRVLSLLRTSADRYLVQRPLDTNVTQVAYQTTKPHISGTSKPPFELVRPRILLFNHKGLSKDIILPVVVCAKEVL
jgi:hypothetical protein